MIKNVKNILSTSWNTPTNKIVAGIGLVFLCVYILPLGIRPLVMPDETRYAEIPREIITTGDWVVPRLNGLRYFEKPVMGYWLNALSIKAFGENPFAVRFPSALSMGLTACLLFFLVRRFTGEPITGGMASLIYLTFLEVFGIGTFNILDGILSFFIGATLMMFYLAWAERESPVRRLLFLVLSGVFCGFSCQTKGFLGVILPIIVIIPFLFWEKDGKKLLTMPWIPLITAILIVFPWGLLIHVKEPSFWNFFVWNEHIRRFMAHDAQHKKSFLYFFLILPMGAFPWTALFPSVISGLKQQGFNDSFIRFTLCWLMFPFLFFSVASGKLATYILPCFAPLAILIARGLSPYVRTENKKAFNREFFGLILFFLFLCSAVVVLQAGGVRGTALYSNGLKAALFSGSLLASTLFLFAAVQYRNRYGKILLLSVSPVIFYLTVPFLVPDRVITEFSPLSFFEKNRGLFDEKTLVVSTSPQISAVCWAFNRQDIYLLEGGGELDYGLSWNDASHRKLSLNGFRGLVSRNRGKGRVVLVIDAKRYTRWQSLLPVPSKKRENGKDGYILACY